MDAYTKFNFLEGLFWIIVGCVFFAASYLAQPRFRNFLIFTAGVFLLFGVSDFLEIKFGSFLEDGMLWLLAWKIACVVGLIAALVWYVRLRMSGSSY